MSFDRSWWHPIAFANIWWHSITFLTFGVMPISCFDNLIWCSSTYVFCILTFSFGCIWSHFPHVCELVTFYHIWWHLITFDNMIVFVLDFLLLCMGFWISDFPGTRPRRAIPRRGQSPCQGEPTIATPTPHQSVHHTNTTPTTHQWERAPTQDIWVVEAGSEKKTPVVKHKNKINTFVGGNYGHLFFPVMSAFSSFMHSLRSFWGLWGLGIVRIVRTEDCEDWGLWEQMLVMFATLSSDLRLHHQIRDFVIRFATLASD